MENLYNMYITQELSTYEIGATLGEYSTTVQRKLKRLGIPLRSRSECHKTSSELDRISGRRKYVIGDKVGMLTILGDYGHNDRGELLYLCRCECGKELKVRANKIPKSCGCRRKI